MSVFTRVTHDELKEFLAGYAVGELLGFQGIGEGVENSNFFVDTTSGRFVLTLFERLNPGDLPFFIGLMEHLGRSGFPSPMPVADRHGQSLRSLNGKPAALVTRLPGQSVLFPEAVQCHAVGRALGDLHLIGHSYPLQCVNARGGKWRAEVGSQLAAEPKLAETDRELIIDELAAQTSLELGTLPGGVIHADLFKDNVLFVEERLGGIIDFYYACNDAWLYDLAVTVNDWCADADGSINPVRISALVDAYRARRQPTSAERIAWPLALRAAALRFYLSRLYDWTYPRAGDLVHVKDPEAYRRILLWHRRNNGALAI